jgi:hypothetical protein
MAPAASARFRGENLTSRTGVRFVARVARRSGLATSRVAELAPVLRVMINLEGGGELTKVHSRDRNSHRPLKHLSRDPSSLQVLRLFEASSSLRERYSFPIREEERGRPKLERFGPKSRRGGRRIRSRRRGNGSRKYDRRRSFGEYRKRGSIGGSSCRRLQSVTQIRQSKVPKTWNARARTTYLHSLAIYHLD